MTEHPERLFLKDEDGDVLELTGVGGFGEPMLALFVRDGEEKDLNGVNLNTSAAIQLRDWINQWLWWHKERERVEDE